MADKFLTVLALHFFPPHVICLFTLSLYHFYLQLCFLQLPQFHSSPPFLSNSTKYRMHNYTSEAGHLRRLHARTILKIPEKYNVNYLRAFKPIGKNFGFSRLFLQRHWINSSLTFLALRNHLSMLQPIFQDYHGKNEIEIAPTRAISPSTSQAQHVKTCRKQLYLFCDSNRQSILLL